MIDFKYLLHDIILFITSLPDDMSYAANSTITGNCPVHSTAQCCYKQEISQFIDSDVSPSERVGFLVAQITTNTFNNHLISTVEDQNVFEDARF